MRQGKNKTEHLFGGWRDLLVTAAEITNDDLARLTIVSEHDVATALVAGSSAAAFAEGQRFAIGERPYCTAVIAGGDAAEIADAAALPQWTTSPDLRRGMRRYLGLPVKWPDGSLFGVIELLGREPGKRPPAQQRLLGHFRDSIQDHLAQVAAAEDRMRADTALRTERERLLLAADVNGLGVWDYNLDEDVLHCDAGWYRIYGRDPAVPVTNFAAVAEFVHPDDIGKLVAARAKNLAGHEPQGSDQAFQFRIIRPNGDVRWISSASRMVEADPHSPNRLVGIVTDITEAHLAEEALRDSYETLQQTERLARIGSWKWHLADDVITWSKSTDELFGWDPTQPQPSFAEAASLFTPDSWERIGVLVQRCLETGEPYSIEAESIRVDGQHFFVHARGQAARDAGGNITSLFGTILDITQRKEAERALAERERWLSDMIENLPIGAVLVTGEQFLANRAVEEITGYSRQELASRDAWFATLIGDESGDRLRLYIENRANGFTRVAKVPFRRKDGTTRMAEMTATLVDKDEIWLMRDITEQERLTDALANERERLLLATEAGGIGVWGVDYADGSVSWDDQMSLLHGLQPGDFGGEAADWHAVLHPEDRDRVLSRWRSEPQATSVYSDEFRIVRPDGAVRYMRLTARVFRNTDGTPRRLAGVNQDVTEARRSAEIMRTAKEAAEAAEKAKSDFLATMSHEIRTPMNTVIGMTQLMLRTELDAKQRNYLEKIDISGKTLLAIINDILDFSKIEAGRLELEDVEFTLESVLESVASVTAVRAEEKGLEIAFGISADVPRVLRGDPLRLSQVLINLVGNAVKFTERGEVVVAVDMTRDVGGPELVSFSVRDTGVGLDAAQLATLFRPFTQAETETARRFGGTGLGLAISKQLVEMMGGRISVESRPGDGSTFAFTIEARRPARDAAVQQDRALDGMRVLIVDDNASARAILAEMVGGFGMVASTAVSGRDALAMLRAASVAGKPYALVLMDWRMPDMDGLETARHIRADESLARTPAILMVTAYGREEVLRKADQLELQGLLIKPITESMMFNALMNLFSPQQIGGANGRTKMHDGEVAGAAAALAGRRILVVDDNAFNREVASELLLSSGMLVDAVDGGERAIEMLRRHSYDAVLMDMQMPGMDGPATTREIRRNPAWATLPIVALTAQARVEDREASLKAGMTAHLTKPVDQALLCRTLLEVLADRPAMNAAVSPLPATDLDLAAALTLTGGDPERLARLLRGFLRDFSTAPARVEALLSAGAMTDLAALAHMVKGSAGYLGARPLVQSADALERAAREAETDAVDLHAAAFLGNLGAVLAAVEADLAAASQRAAVPAAALPAELPILLGEIEPLVARGDFAASALLSRLAGLLDGHEQAATVELARSHFEDLELDAALAALARLKASLGQSRDGGAA